MKLDPTGKPIRIRIIVGGEEHSTLDTLKEHFDFDDVIRLWGNGSLLRWLNQIGASEVRQKLSSTSPKDGKLFSAEELKELLACFGICDVSAVNLKMIEKYKKENNATALVRTLAMMAQEGDSDAAFELSGYYYNGEFGVSLSDTLSLKYALMAAQRGHIEAQCKVANNYLQGIGSNKSVSEAIEWYEKAVEQGSVEANYNLGLIYYSGVKNQLEKSYAQAVQYFLNASKSNYKVSNFYVAKCMIYLGQNEDALNYFNKTVLQSDGIEILKAKDWYEFALLLIDFSPNDNRIEEYFLKSAEKDYPEAQSHLGWLYCKGKYGIKKNEIEGVKWIRKAANANDSLGQKLMGDCYKNGIVVNPNNILALSWYKKAALQGHEGALKELISLLEDELIYHPYNYLSKEVKIAIKQAADNGMKEAKRFVKDYSNWL